MLQKKQIVLSLLAFSVLAFADRPKFNLEEEIAKENLEYKYQDEYVNAQIMTKKALYVAEETLASLKANLSFIHKLEKSKSFRKLTVLKDKLKELTSFKNSAKRLLSIHKISQRDYDDYLIDLKNQKTLLNRKIKNMKVSK